MIPWVARVKSPVGAGLAMNKECHRPRRGKSG
jgi:hypothetical protein